jgi:hypothetical protein
VTGRLTTTLFAALCAGGAASALVLTVVEARATDPVVAHVSSKVRAGLTTTVAVEVRNTTVDKQCARVRVVAMDRAGHDLGSSGSTVLRLPRKANRTIRTDFTLTEREYDERLSTVRVALDRCG